MCVTFAVCSVRIGQPLQRTEKTGRHCVQAVFVFKENFMTILKMLISTIAVSSKPYTETKLFLSLCNKISVVLDTQYHLTKDMTFQETLGQVPASEELVTCPSPCPKERFFPTRSQWQSDPNEPDRGSHLLRPPHFRHYYPLSERSQTAGNWPNEETIQIRKQFILKCMLENMHLINISVTV
jgi:hypothetical protein